MLDPNLKQKIRPVYSELQGYLNQSPSVGEHGVVSTPDNTLKDQFNRTLIELNEVTGMDFAKFKVIGSIERNSNYMYISEYRSKLGGLITRLHGTYFYDEPAPFYGMPSTTITVSNQQEQAQHQTIILEMGSLIDKKLANLPEGNEKSFLAKLKEGLGGVKDFTSLMILLAKLGHEYGISVEQLGSLFK